MGGTFGNLGHESSMHTFGESPRQILVVHNFFWLANSVHVIMKLLYMSSCGMANHARQFQ
jgi:hypothetical protein